MEADRLMRLFVVLALFFTLCQSQEPSEIKFVHVVFTNHLDVGFNGGEGGGLAYEVINHYFDHYFPSAVSTAAELRARGGPERLVYTTHSWLVWLYLNCHSYVDLVPGQVHCPNSTAQANFIKAVKEGDITWHAFPFNTQVEVFMKLDFVQRAVKFAHDLDDMIGQPRRTVMSQRDVPGMTRAIIPALRGVNVTAVTVGVNGASAVADVPKAFLWVDKQSNTDIIAMWHGGGYGGIGVSDCVMVPGFTRALAFAFRSDNSGPPGADEVIGNFATLKKEFPNAEIIADTYDNFVAHLETVRSKLPVYTSEIGDTWIHGIASDPLKLAQFRTVVDARSACVASKKCDVEDPAFKKFDFLLTKIPEHTWGLDVKTFLHDASNWTNAEFDAARNRSNFQLMVESWSEQREYVTNAVKALGNTAFASELDELLKELTPKPVDTTGWTKVMNLSQIFDVGQLTIGFDSHNGAITHLSQKSNNKQWASAKNPLAQFKYQTYSNDDFVTFLKTYMNFDPNSLPWWAFNDFGKPGMENPSAIATPVLKNLFTRKNGTSTLFLVNVFFNNADYYVKFGAPRDIWLEISVAHNSSKLSVDLKLFEKTTTRLAESLWFSFVPNFESTSDSWTFSKLGSINISAADVMLNGSRHLHAVSDEFKLTSKANHFIVKTYDAPLVSFGAPNAFPTPLKTEPDFSQGANVGLYNNLWGTNYIMWYPYLPEDSNMRFRFDVSLV